jgi:hypothetical protein
MNNTFQFHRANKFILFVLPAHLLMFFSFEAISANADLPSQKSLVKKFLSDQPVRFLENKGQMKDMKKNPVPSVLFKAAFPGMNVYVTQTGLTYLFVKTEEKISADENNDEDGSSEKIETKLAWINMSLAGAFIKRENIVKEQMDDVHSNYFYPHCSDGRMGVKQFEKITVKDVYPGIDWVLYGTEKTGMKYDFIVHKGSSPDLIKLIYDSEEPLTLNSNGDIEIKSPLGTLQEKAPYSFLQNSRQQVPSRYVARQMDSNHVEISFAVDNYESNTLIIDPQLWWGTMYGGSTDELDGPSSIDVDVNGNLYVVGYTTSPDFPVLNAGTYYDSVLVGGLYDLYIMKFTNTGVLLWSTYYGGSGDERSPYEVPFITTDKIGNIFIVGQTFSPDLPLQNAGTYFDSTFNGSLNYISDAFILKFDSAGNRLWATYFGGDNQDRAISAACDTSGSLFVTGFTSSSIDFPLQSWGAAYFDNSFNGGTSDAFIARFNNAGNLIWSSYFGGSGEDHGLSVTADVSGNVFLTGETASANFPLQNNGTFYDDTLGGTDAIIARFDNAGNLTWSTYFGGSAAFSLDWGLSIRTDKNNNVFLMGYTNSTDLPLMNSGTYFDSIIGFADKDMFISKFSNAGSLLWSTYFGGAGSVNTSWDFLVYDNLEIDTSGNAYISFNRAADAVPTYDPGCGAYYDTTGRITLAEFSNSGSFLWGTNLGAANNEVRGPIATDHYNNLFIAGEFNGYSSIAGLPLLDPGGGAYFSTTLGPASAGNHQAFQLKFIPDACSIVPNFVADDNHICPGTCINFLNSTTGATSYQWFFQGALPDTSTAFSPQNICYSSPGNYSVSLIATGAVGSDTLSLNNYIQVYPSPPPQSITQNGDTLFANAGAVFYQWYHNAVLIPGATDYFYIAPAGGDYNVVATDANGCEVEAVVFNVIAGTQSFDKEYLPLVIYPDPATDKFTVQSKWLSGIAASEGSCNITIYNMLGKKIFAAILNQRDESITVKCDLFPPGIYLLEAGTPEKNLHAKFVKQ